MSTLIKIDTALNPVLEQATDNDLQPLVEYLEKKLSQGLTTHELYKANHPEHSKYSNVIADEIREMGGNSIANLLRKDGVSYHEIVYDVTKKLKVKVDKTASVEQMEDAIIEKILSDAIGHMTEEEQLELFKELNHGDVSIKGAAVATAIKLFRAGGFKSYQLTVIIANQIARVVLGRGLTLATNAALTRWVSIFAGPVGWVISGAWTAIDIAGPAYSVTIPCVIHIAMLRRKQQVFDEELKPLINTECGIEKLPDVAVVGLGYEGIKLLAGIKESFKDVNSFVISTDRKLLSKNSTIGEPLLIDRDTLEGDGCYRVNTKSLQEAMEVALPTILEKLAPYKLVFILGVLGNENECVEPPLLVDGLNNKNIKSICYINNLRSQQDDSCLKSSLMIIPDNTNKIDNALRAMVLSSKRALKAFELTISVSIENDDFSNLIKVLEYYGYGVGVKVQDNEAE